MARHRPATRIGHPPSRAPGGRVGAPQTAATKPVGRRDLSSHGKARERIVSANRRIEPCKFEVEMSLFDDAATFHKHIHASPLRARLAGFTTPRSARRSPPGTRREVRLAQLLKRLCMYTEASPHWWHHPSKTFSSRRSLKMRAHGKTGTFNSSPIVSITALIARVRAFPSTRRARSPSGPPSPACRACARVHAPARGRHRRDLVAHQANQSARRRRTSPSRRRAPNARAPRASLRVSPIGAGGSRARQAWARTSAARSWSLSPRPKGVRGRERRFERHRRRHRPVPLLRLKLRGERASRLRTRPLVREPPAQRRPLREVAQRGFDALGSGPGKVVPLVLGDVLPRARRVVRAGARPEHVHACAASATHAEAVRALRGRRAAARLFFFFFFFFFDCFSVVRTATRLVARLERPARPLRAWSTPARRSRASATNGRMLCGSCALWRGMPTRAIAGSHCSSSGRSAEHPEMSRSLSVLSPTKNRSAPSSSVNAWGRRRRPRGASGGGGRRRRAAAFPPAYTNPAAAARADAVSTSNATSAAARRSAAVLAVAGAAVAAKPLSASRSSSGPVVPGKFSSPSAGPARARAASRGRGVRPARPRRVCLRRAPGTSARAVDRTGALVGADSPCVDGRRRRPVPDSRCQVAGPQQPQPRGGEGTRTRARGRRPRSAGASLENRDETLVASAEVAASDADADAEEASEPPTASR